MKNIKVRFRKGSWIILPALTLSWFISPTNVKAENYFGINITVYNNSTPYNEYNNAPPLPPTTPVAGEYVGTRIENYFDQSPVFNLWDDFVVKYEGYISSPCTCDIQFMAQADDGTQLYLDDQLITYDWWDKGEGGSISEPISFTQGVSKHIVLWFYENGGGAWVQLWWMHENIWQIVPDSAFTLNNPVPPVTTVPETIPEPVTTTVPETTTTQPTETTVPRTTIPTTIVPETTTTIQQKPITEETTTTTTIAPVVIPEPQIKPISNEDVDNVISKLISGDITPSEVISILDNSDISTDNVQKIIDTLIDNGIDSSSAQQLASNPTVLESITVDQATQIFETINISELSNQEEEILIQSITNAPDKIKNTFENTIDIFGQGLDKYIPLGSKVDVKTRRAIIAVTAVVSTVSISGATGPIGGGSPSTNNNPSGTDGNSNSENRRRRRI